MEHWSVGACRQEAARAIDLASCLRAFTSCERLEQRYHCGHCRSAQPATKKLQIWRLPPILVCNAALFTRNMTSISTRKKKSIFISHFSPTDSPFETVPICEQQMDKVTEGGKLPVPRLRPHSLLSVSTTGDQPTTFRNTQL